MNIDTLIIGGGLCGTWLSHWLRHMGDVVAVMHDPNGSSASAAASGIINPVTGRRVVKTWMIDELMPFAEQAYAAFNGSIKRSVIIDMFQAPDVEVAFKKKLAERTAYISAIDDTSALRQHFHFQFGAGAIDPCYLIDVNLVLQTQKALLQDAGLWLDRHFDESALVLLHDGIRYEEIHAQRVIYCDGVAGALSSFFYRLPFAANKGEALIVEIPDLPHDKIYKRGMSIVPWKDELFWIGSNYDWDFEDAHPTKIFREQAEAWLRSFCRHPFKVVDHVAGVRPATVERRPFVGFHPLHAQVGIFNGMGTKGVSLAPYFGREFASAIKDGAPIPAEVDVARFSKTLSR